MKNQIKAYSLLLLSAVLLSACAASAVKDKPAKNNIEKISISQTNGTVPPNYRTLKTMELGSSDLRLNEVVKDYKGSVTTNTTVKITQVQFDALVKEVHMLDIAKLKSKVHPIPKVGGGTITLKLRTVDGVYQFTRNGSTEFPPVIGRLFNGVTQLISSH